MKTPHESQREGVKLDVDWIGRGEGTDRVDLCRVRSRGRRRKTQFERGRGKEEASQAHADEQKGNKRSYF